jgi:predicted phosphoribosyltransferase
MFFQDRVDAGQRLVPLVERYKGADNAIVLGLPRGGIVVALEVARELELPLDVWVTRKIGAPMNPELAIGSVDTDGNANIDENATMLHDVSERYIREEIERATGEIRRRYLTYRGSEEPPDVKGKTVLVVDDGIATGFTMIAALQSLRSRDADKIVCITPVASPRVVTQLGELADEVESLSTPSYFSSVGEFYRDFSQVDDDEVIASLETAKGA